MHAKITRPRRLALGFLAAVLIGGAGLVREMSAFNPQPDPPGFGMVGIADGQTARINLVNLAAVDPVTGAIPPPCRARLQFVNALGDVIAARGVAPGAGRATFLDYVFTSPPEPEVAPLLRAEIRPVIISDDGLLPPPCRITVELFDNLTGRTSVALYPPPCRGACRATQ